MATMILTGDVNLMNVDDPTVPFSRMRQEFQAADLVFSNLECCLYDSPSGHAVENEGFFASPEAGGEALRQAGISAVGIANNVNYGDAAITASIGRLDELGIAHTGAGMNVAMARAPIVMERHGLRYGFLQRSSVYWPTNHEAGPNSTGIAVIRAHTAYQVPMHKTRPDIPPLNRPEFRRSSSPGRTRIICAPSSMTSPICDQGWMSSSRPVTGDFTRMCSRICARLAMRRSMPVPISSSGTARTTCCRSRCIAASRSFMVWGVFRSTRAMADAHMATGSG